MRVPLVEQAMDMRRREIAGKNRQRQSGAGFVSTRVREQADGEFLMVNERRSARPKAGLTKEGQRFRLNSRVADSSPSRVSEYMRSSISLLIRLVDAEWPQ